MANIRGVDAIASKWARVTPQRTQDYEEGIRNPRADWAQATAAAEGNYKDGVTKAAQAGSFGKGVRRVGSGKWQKGASEKGAQRFGAGVAVAQSDFAAGFAPFASAIQAAQLPPRFARRDPRNLQRVNAVVAALVAAKERGTK